MSVDTLASQSAATIFLQDACLDHRYLRSRDVSGIVERPERLRAVKIGIAAVIARLEELYGVALTRSSGDADELADAISRMEIASRDAEASTIPLDAALPVRIARSVATLDILNHPAVKYIHGDIDGDVYLEELRELIKGSAEKIASGKSEIPEGHSQGDLYLCPTSLNAIQGALGTVCEAVDSVVNTSRANLSASSSPSHGIPRAFCCIRPPGHHCGEDTPSGFCFVNNVAVGAAHAYLKYGINKIVILDIDLHHGNGTQSIVWQINEEAHRQKLERQAGDPGPSKDSLQVYYGSVHDILSYPCEDGKAELIQAASVSIHGPHSQFIENVHLKPYESEEQFWNVLYPGTYYRLFDKAHQFLESTGSNGEDAMVFISAGFDASEHEYPSMSRHNRKVPTSFYHHFTRDACSFADKWSGGRIVSVLEGGYSDKALLSGAMAHLVGLIGTHKEAPDLEAWWAPDAVEKLSKITKRKRSNLPLTTNDAPSPWLDRTTAVLATIDATILASSSRTKIIPPNTRTLRSRSKAHTNESDVKNTSAPTKLREVAKAVSSADSPAISTSESSSSEEDMTTAAISAPTQSAGGQKKLPRVILKMGQRPPVQ